MKRLIPLLILMASCDQRPSFRITTPAAEDAGTAAAPDVGGGHPDASTAHADAATIAPDAEVACVPPSGNCAEAPCCAGSFCEGNPYVMTNAHCVPQLELGEACDRDEMCSSGSCAEGLCAATTCAAQGAACFGADFPCCAGLACDAPADSYGPGACLPVLAVGEPCASDPQCASGRCTMGRCDEPAPAGPATFARVFEEVLVRNGCTNGYCHGAGAGGLVLQNADDAHRALVGAATASPVCGSGLRVAAGRPEDSVLWRKIAPGVSACGSKMPPAVGQVSPDAAELVRAWIAGGALR